MFNMTQISRFNQIETANYNLGPSVRSTCSLGSGHTHWHHAPQSKVFRHIRVIYSYSFILKKCVGRRLLVFNMRTFYNEV